MILYVLWYHLGSLTRAVRWLVYYFAALLSANHRKVTA